MAQGCIFCNRRGTRRAQRFSQQTAPRLGLEQYVGSREFDSEVGQRLREWRSKRGFSQYALAGAVGITQASLSNYETGKRELPLGTALRLTAPLDITLANLLPI